MWPFLKMFMNCIFSSLFFQLYDHTTQYFDTEYRFLKLYELSLVVKKMEEIDAQSEIVKLLNDISLVALQLTVAIPFHSAKWVIKTVVFGMLLLLILGNKLHISRLVNFGNLVYRFYISSRI